MNFVADEGVDAPIVEALRSVGHDVLYIAEIKSGISDDKVLAYANEEDRILITRDKDFGELVYREKKIHSGIILNRLYVFDSLRKAEILKNVIEKYGTELVGAFTVIQPHKVRIKKL